MAEHVELKKTLLTNLLLPLLVILIGSIGAYSVGLFDSFLKSKQPDVIRTYLVDATYGMGLPIDEQSGEQYTGWDLIQHHFAEIDSSTSTENKSFGARIYGTNNADCTQQKSDFIDIEHKHEDYSKIVNLIAAQSASSREQGSRTFFHLHQAINDIKKLRGKDDIPGEIIAMVSGLNECSINEGFDRNRLLSDVSATDKVSIDTLVLVIGEDKADVCSSEYFTELKTSAFCRVVTTKVEINEAINAFSSGTQIAHFDSIQEYKTQTTDNNRKLSPQKEPKALLKLHQNIQSK